MDFINLWPHHVTDLIFQCCSAKELLEMTLVSREWSQYIGQSDVMKKIVIKPKDKEGAKILMQSNRKYRNVKVVRGTEIAGEVVEIITNPQHKFNSIEIVLTEFENKKQIEQIFKNNCLHLEDLLLGYVTFKDDGENSFESFHFPHLKKLKLMYLSRPQLNEAFASFQNLEHLYLYNGWDKKINELIKESTKLKKLDFVGKVYGIIFHELAITSQLDELSFHNIKISLGPYMELTLSSCNNFLKTQSDNLLRYKTDFIIYPEDLLNAFRMKKLVELKVNRFFYDYDFLMPFIEDLKHPVKPATLTNFSVKLMDKVLFYFLAINARNLKKMTVEKFEPIDVSVPTFFTVLESISIISFNAELKNGILQKTDAERSHFEKLVLAEIIESENYIIVQEEDDEDEDDDDDDDDQEEDENDLVNPN